MATIFLRVSFLMLVGLLIGCSNDTKLASCKITPEKIVSGEVASLQFTTKSADLTQVKKTFQQITPQEPLGQFLEPQCRATGHECTVTIRTPRVPKDTTLKIRARIEDKSNNNDTCDVVAQLQRRNHHSWKEVADLMKQMAVIGAQKPQK